MRHLQLYKSENQRLLQKELKSKKVKSKKICLPFAEICNFSNFLIFGFFEGGQRQVLGVL